MPVQAAEICAPAADAVTAPARARPAACGRAKNVFRYVHRCSRKSLVAKLPRIPDQRSAEQMTSRQRLDGQQTPLVCERAILEELAVTRPRLSFNASCDASCLRTRALARHAVACPAGTERVCMARSRLALSARDARKQIARHWSYLGRSRSRVALALKALLSSVAHADASRWCCARGSSQRVAPARARRLHSRHLLLTHLAVEHLVREVVGGWVLVGVHYSCKPCTHRLRSRSGVLRPPRAQAAAGEQRGPPQEQLRQPPTQLAAQAAPSPSPLDASPAPRARPTGAQRPGR